MVGTPSPFHEDRVIEALSDSNLYMVYFPFAEAVNEHGLRPEQLTDELFDHVLLGERSREEAIASGVREQQLERIMARIEERYPIDLNVAGFEHLDVHIPYFLFHHATVLPERFFPEEVIITSHVMYNGEKMSKSKGNVLYLDDLLEHVRSEKPAWLSGESSMDAIRFFLASYQSLDRDFDWSDEEFATVGQKHLFDFARTILERDPSIPPQVEPAKDADKWLSTKMHRSVRRVTAHLEERTIRHAVVEAFYTTGKTLKSYKTMAEEPNERLLGAALETQLQLLYPIIPRLSTEVHNRAFNSAIPRWPDATLWRSFNEEHDQLEHSLNGKAHAKSLQGLIHREVGKAIGRGDIEQGADVEVCVPSRYMKELLEERSRTVAGSKVTFSVDSGTDEPYLIAE